MNKYLRNAVICLIALFALLGVGVWLTDAHRVLMEVSIDFLAVGCIFFILSILAWLFSWGYLLKKRTKVGYRHSIPVGFSAVYGSLTPVQLGAEALRAMGMKEHFGVRYSDSVAASMVAKGTKFCILGMTAIIVFLLFFMDIGFDPCLLLAFYSGLCVIFLAVFLFLSPLYSPLAVAIAGFFKRLSKKVPRLVRVADFFTRYPGYLKQLNKSSFLAVFLLVAASWLFEFLALQYSFLSMGVSMPLHSLLIFMVLVSVLERTPLLPRGIGLVELVGYHFLAFPELVAGTTLSVGQIVSVLVAYDFVRLVVPTVLSMAFGFLTIKRSK